MLSMIVALCAVNLINSLVDRRNDWRHCYRGTKCCGGIDEEPCRYSALLNNWNRRHLFDRIDIHRIVRGLEVNVYLNDAEVNLLVSLANSKGVHL